MTQTVPNHWPPRPTLSHLTLNLIASGYILVVLNTGYWARMVAIFDWNALQIGLFGLASLGLTVLTLEFFGPGRLQKPVVAVLIVLAASASYYERNFGVLIDRDMVRNVLSTTVNESRHLIDPAMLMQISVTGVLPAALVFWPRVARIGRWHHLWRWPLGVALSGAVVVGALMGDYKAFSATLRERDELMGSYQPGATLVALVRYGRQQWRSADPVVRAVATDATPGPHLAQVSKPVLLVFFAGETARAQNFGLNGYARNTTPGLAERSVINFPDVTACGTSTAVSLPCMFSPLAQSGYSREGFLSHENLLDVLARAGFAVSWVDNNTGDQRIAYRTGWSMVDATLAPDACKVECTDAVFLPLIRQTLDTMTTNTVLVLHMIGNHGPAYHLRYAPERALFQPECATSRFSDCTLDQIVNAYDNAMLETDHVLSRAIDMLAASNRVLPAMVFVSDHGESLGENGLFLHAAPRFMAPDTQLKVPMVMWLGDAFAQAMALDAECLAQGAAQPTSHDMVFHTVLGLLDVTTKARDPALDLTSGCRAEMGL